MADPSQHRADLSRQYTSALWAGWHDLADALRAELDRLERHAGDVPAPVDECHAEPRMDGSPTPEGEQHGD